MLNNWNSRALRKHLLLALLLAPTVGFAQAPSAEILTLFTTSQERQVINANRYKTERVVKPRTVVEPETEVRVPVVQQEVTLSFVISGITISRDGPHSVWINNEVYEEGDHLEDNSHFKVLTEENIRVRITTPDGNNHYGTAGETVEVTYLAAVEDSDETD